MTTRAGEIVEALTRRGQCLAVAESLTGGLVAGELTAVPGAGSVFTAGFVAYVPQMKIALLGVPADLIETAGVVSRDVASAMAVGARRHGLADWGIGTTGAAGPDSHGGQEPGTVCVAVAGPDGVTSESRVFQGGREHVRRETTRLSLDLLADGLGFAAR